jgi:primosomal protein N''
VRALFEEAEAVDAEGDERFGPDGRGDELPEELQRREQRLARIREAKQALEAVAAEREAARRAELEAQDKKPRRPPRGRDPYAPKPSAQRNFTDPESKIMKTSDGAYHQRYNGQAIVDSRAQVIVACELSDQAPDARQLEPALDQLAENLDAIEAELPEDAALTADAGYFSEDNVRISSQHGLDAHIATGRFKHSEPPPPAPRAGSQDRHPQAADGTQAAHEEGPRRLRPPQSDRRASLRPAGHRPERAAAAATRQTGRPRAVALPLCDPQSAQAPPGGRTRPDQRAKQPSCEPFSSETARPRDAREVTHSFAARCRRPLADRFAWNAPTPVTDPGS